MPCPLLISPLSCPRTGSISDTDSVQQKRPQNAWTHFKHNNFCRFLSVQPLDCSTFPCWHCIKHNSDRKAVTCPSNQRTVVCDGDLSMGCSGEGSGARPGQPHQTSVHIMNLPLVLITYWYESLAHTITGSDYSAPLSLSLPSTALVPKSSFSGANRPSFHWPHSLTYLLFLLFKHKSHLYFSLRK